MERRYDESAVRRVTVMGLGTFGGGVGAARFFAERGVEVTVTDLKDRGELSESISRLGGLGIRFVLGRHDTRDFTDTDLVVVSPAVPRDSEYVEAARRNGVPLQTEIGLFVERCPAPLCGVTGSVGKTTTVSMLGSILEHSGRPHHVGGNIGGSLLPALPEISEDDVVVLELSSFQLEWLAEMSWSPHIAAVLNILPNHLDRHGTMENYLEAKAAILEHQDTRDYAVLVRDDPGSRSLSGRTRARLVWVGTALDSPGVTLLDGWMVERGEGGAVPLCEVGRLAVPGKHMVADAMTAAACARVMGIGADAIAGGLASFRGLPHRLEKVGGCGGVTFYNDSKATTPEAAAAAVEAFDAPVVAILGGYDKGAPFEEMAERMAGRVKWAALIGRTAPRISAALDGVGVEHAVFPSLEEAFAGCVARAREGDIVLLSPGCASYDMFANFEERGEAFRRLVEGHVGSCSGVPGEGGA